MYFLVLGRWDSVSCADDVIDETLDLIFEINIARPLLALLHTNYQTTAKLIISEISHCDISFLFGIGNDVL